MPRKTKLPAEARRREIRERLNNSSSISIAGIAAELGVSEMTIRRDLVELEQNSQVRRTHGGAVVAERTVFEFNYAERQRQRGREKLAMARAAASLVSSGQTIILDTGTSTLHLARALRGVGGLTIITPSLAVASELQFEESVTVILLGGMLHRGSPDLTGPLTEHCLEVFSADWVFQGAEAVGADGTVFNIDLQLAQVDRKMRQRATRSCLLADHSKFGQIALVRNGSLKDFDVLVTDSGISSKHLRSARKLARSVVVAPV